MYFIIKPEKCSPNLQFEVQPIADMGSAGNKWLLFFEEIITYTSDFLGVLILPVLVGIIFILNIFMFKSFKVKGDDSKNKGK